jgi:hypothetical protein
MNKYVLAFAFLAVLLALAPSVHAQATGSDCSTADQPTKTWNQQPPDVNCNGDHDQSFTVYSTTVDTCTDQNTGTAYAQAVRQTTGIGWWSTTGASGFCSSDVTQKCNPTITQQVTHALSSTDYNRFYLRAWDAVQTTRGTTPCATKVDMSRQDFWQCPGVDCNTSAGPPCYVDNSCADGPSPIIIDVAGNGFALTNAANGVTFDISGTGHPIQMGWTAPGANNAFLALPGADGLVHNGQQLFGNFTPQPKSTTPNGFAALAVYDQPADGGNGDGIIDARDAVFSSLRLWIDANHDGIAQANELFTLPSLGVNSISLNYKADRRTDQYGNVFHYRSQVNPGGSTNTGRMAYDVFFVRLPAPTAKNIIPADTNKCRVPVLVKGGMLSTSGK